MDCLGKPIDITRLDTVDGKEYKMAQIITATGKTFESDYFVPMQDPAVLFTRILKQPEEVVRAVFSDRSETACLKYGSRVAFGYINLQSILKEGDAFKVMLSK